MAHYRATKYIFVTLSYQVPTDSTPDQGPLDLCDQAWIQEDKHSYVVEVDDITCRLFCSAIRGPLTTSCSLPRYITVEKCILM